MNYTLKKKIAFGKKGIITEVRNDADDVSAPIVEINTIDMMKMGTIHADLNFNRKITELYTAWGKFGPYGDVIQLTYHDAAASPFYTVDFIGNLAWHKPGLAADIVPIIEGNDGTRYIVGIVRNQEPGKGKFAIVGGHRDVNGWHFETGMEAGVREAKEEINLDIQYHTEEDKKNAFENPDQNKIKVKIFISGYRWYDLRDYYLTSLVKVGTYQTACSEVEKTTGLKRIYETAAYACKILVPEHLTTEKVKAMFKPREEEVSDVVVLVIGRDGKIITDVDFGLDHHERIVKNAIEKLILK